jgi:ABC-2 type transport system permease protein
LMIAGTMTLVSIALMGSQITSPVLFIISLSLTVLTLSALGALVAVSVREVFEAQTLSNYFRFPMIFLCGVFLPVEAMPMPLQALAHILPLTYSVDALRQTSMGMVNLRLLSDIAALVLFLLAFLILATRSLKKNLE